MEDMIARCKFCGHTPEAERAKPCTNEAGHIFEAVPRSLVMCLQCPYRAQALREGGKVREPDPEFTRDAEGRN